MHILIVNRFADNEQVPTARMLSDVADILTAKECALAILTSSNNYTAKPPAAAQKQNIAYHYIKTPAVRGPAWLIFWIAACLKVPFMKWDVCVLMTDPPFLTVLAPLARLLNKKRYLFWWTMDLYPESLTAANILKKQGLTARLLRALNRFGARGLTGIISLGPRQKELLATTLQNLKQKPPIKVISPWDYRLLPKIEASQNTFLKAVNPEQRQIALYAGNLGHAHSFEDLTDAARQLNLNPSSRWLFLFVCRGFSRPLLEASVEGLSNVKVMDYLPAARTAELLWSATVHLITMADGWDGVVVPSKLYGTLKTEAPILFVGPENSDTALEIRHYQRGITLPNQCGGRKVAAALEKLARQGKLPPLKEDQTGAASVAETLNPG